MVSKGYIMASSIIYRTEEVESSSDRAGATVVGWPAVVGML